MARDFEFDDNDRLVLTNSRSWSPTDGPLTLVWRIKLESISGQTFVSQKDGAGTGRSLLWMGGGGEFRSSFGGATLEGSVLSTATEYHIGLTHDGGTGTARLWLDGVEDASAARTAENADGDLVIGSFKGDTAGDFDGIGAEFALFGREFGSAEMAALNDDRSPLHFLGDLLYYIPMVRDLYEYMVGATITEKGTGGPAVVEHFRTFYPVSGFAPHAPAAAVSSKPYYYTTWRRRVA